MRRILAAFFARPLPVTAGIASTVTAALVLLAMPVLAGRALDPARVADAAGVQRAALLFLACAAGEGTLRWLARRLLIGESRRAEESLKRAIERHVVRLPVASVDAARTGDLLSRMSQDVELLRFVTGPLLLYGTQALIVVPGGIALVMRSSTAVAIGAGLLFAVMAIGLRWLGPRIERRSDAAQQALAAIAEHTSERAVGIRVVQAFHRLLAEDRAMTAKASEVAERGYAVARLQALVDLVIHVAVELVVLLGLAVGAIEVARGASTPGALLEYWALLGVQLGPLMALGFVFGGLPRAFAAGHRVEAIFANPRETVLGGTLPAGPGRLEVRGLTWSHPGAASPVLQDVSFTLEPGTTLAIVGTVGSGKSTLVDLVMRLREPPRGAVFLDGHDVLDLAPAALRAHFAVALQDPFLFSDTIAANVRFGADDADVAAAVADAGLGPDLAALAAGVETVVGERGVTLSGGQRQRVALARALASRRPVLVLDDTLSAVDHATESRILANLRARHLSGRTAIVVTHRLSAARHADRILVLEAGRVAAFGPHAELVRSCTTYAATWRSQREQSALEGETVDARGREA